jgi:hypothetical protein
VLQLEHPIRVVEGFPQSSQRQRCDARQLFHGTENWMQSKP